MSTLLYYNSYIVKWLSKEEEAQNLLSYGPHGLCKAALRCRTTIIKKYEKITIHIFFLFEKNKIFFFKINHIKIVFFEMDRSKIILNNTWHLSNLSGSPWLREILSWLQHLYLPHIFSYVCANLNWTCNLHVANM